MTRPAPDGTTPSLWKDLKRAAWRLKWWGALLGGLLLLILGLQMLIQYRAGTLKKEREEEAARRAEERMTVDVWTIAPREFVDEVELPGMVHAWEDLTLAAEVSGRVVEILKEEGDAVGASEPIIRLDDREYKAALDRAEAQYKLAELTVTRRRELRGRGAISQAELDGAEADYRVAQAAAAAARLNVERCTLRAPFPAVLNRRQVAPGTLIQPGTAIAQLLDLRRVKVDIAIPEADRAKVEGLREASFRLISQPGRVFSGRCLFLSEQPIAQAQAYLLRLEAENGDGALKPGMFVRARIERGRHPDAIVVPLFAVVTRGEKRFCYVEEEERARRRPVELGLIREQAVRILSGLTAGERLIVRGQRQVEDGQSIAVLRRLDGAGAEALP